MGLNRADRAELLVLSSPLAFDTTNWRECVPRAPILSAVNDGTILENNSEGMVMFCPAAQNLVVYELGVRLTTYQDDLPRPLGSKRWKKITSSQNKPERSRQNSGAKMG